MAHPECASLHPGVSGYLVGHSWKMWNVIGCPGVRLYAPQGVEMEKCVNRPNDQGVECTVIEQDLRSWISDVKQHLYLLIYPALIATKLQVDLSGQIWMLAPQRYK